MNVETLLATAKRELDAAEKAQERADGHYWKAAEAMWRANKEQGIGTRAIAEAVSRSQKLVSSYVRTWEVSSALLTKPRWSEAFNEVNPRGDHTTEARKRMRDPETLREDILSDPEIGKSLSQVLASDDEVASKAVQDPMAALRLRAADDERTKKATTRRQTREKVEEALDPDKGRAARNWIIQRVKSKFDTCLSELQLLRAQWPQWEIDLSADEEHLQLARDLIRDGLLELEVEIARVRGENLADEAEAFLKEGR
jgi:hypothetical protein